MPDPDPAARLPEDFADWEAIAVELPKLLAAGQARLAIENLPRLNADGLRDEASLRRAMVILSFLGHAYVWGEADAAARIPACLAVPWHEVGRRLGRPPVLSYASYALDNWRRFRLDRPIELGNIVLRQNFLGGQDEEWFILVHVAIEARAAAAIAGIAAALEAVRRDDAGEVTAALGRIAGAIDAMHAILLRMPERCDPYIYYHRVRPYLHGWSNHPAVPDGVQYEGVEAYGGKPQKFRGETGAQSAIVPSLDAALGIVHKEGQLKSYLMEMRDYMPPAHRAFVEMLEAGPPVRGYVLGMKGSFHPMGEAYDACVEGLERFRSTHLEYARSYIQRQSQSANNPVATGTGGTPFIPYLKKHRDETTKHRIGKG